MKVDAAESLRVLVSLTRELSEQKLELDSALQRVTDAALHLLAGQHASLRILDDAGESLLSGARSGAGRMRAPQRFQRGEGVAGWVIQSGEAALIPDVSSDERFVDRPQQGYQIGSMASVPLWAAGRVVGALTLTSVHQAHFDEDDLTLLRLLANCAAPALDRARLERMAITDAHTGALNRGQLDRVFKRLMRDPNTGALSILELDLDHFKRVNDTYGHGIGDEVLREFVRRIRSLIRVEDVVIRRGGEEFIVALPQCDRFQAAVAAQRIRQRMAHTPIEIDASRIAVDSTLPPNEAGEAPTSEVLTLIQEVSIGVAQWNGKESPEELEQRVDAALYDAKRKGRNRVEVAT